MSRLLVWGCLGTAAVGVVVAAVTGLAWLGSEAGGELGMALGVGVACAGALGLVAWVKGR